MIEKDKYGLYINAGNYKECLKKIKESEKIKMEWGAIPHWRRFFINKAFWYLRQI